MRSTTTEELWDAIHTSVQYMSKLASPCKRRDRASAASECTCLDCEKQGLDESYLRKVLSSIQIALPTIEQRLETRISQMQARRESLEHSLEARKHFNNNRHVNQLPSEIFAMIMETFLREVSIQPLHHRNLGTLRLVCSSWNARIIQCAALWSFIPAHKAYYNPKVVDMYLERSKAVPLSVWYSIDHVIFPFPGETGEAPPEPAFPEVVMAESSRWKSISLILENPEDFLPFTTITAPKLEDLEVSSYGSGNASRRLDLFGETAPCLRRVVIRTLPIRWDSGIFRALEELVVEAVYEVPLTHLTDILLECPTIRLLRIRDCEITDDRIRALVAPRTLSLHHLQNLDLVQLSANVTAHLLQHFDIPAVQKLMISPKTYSRHNTDALLQAASTFVGRLDKMLSNLRRVQLSVDEVRISGWTELKGGMEIENSDVTLEFQLIPLVDWASWIQQRFLSALSDEAEVTVILGQQPYQDILPKIDRSQSVLSIKILSSEMQARTFVEYIGHPNIDGSGERYWPFSAATRMTFEGREIDFQLVLNMLVARYGAEAKIPGYFVGYSCYMMGPPPLWPATRPGDVSPMETHDPRDPQLPAPLQMLQLPPHHQTTPYPPYSMPTPAYPGYSPYLGYNSTTSTSYLLEQIQLTVGEGVLNFEPCRPLR